MTTVLQPINTLPNRRLRSNQVTQLTLRKLTQHVVPLLLRRGPRPRQRPTNLLLRKTIRNLHRKLRRIRQDQHFLANQIPQQGLQRIILRTLALTFERNNILTIWTSLNIQLPQSRLPQPDTLSNRQLRLQRVLIQPHESILLHLLIRLFLDRMQRDTNILTHNPRRHRGLQTTSARQHRQPAPRNQLPINRLPRKMSTSALRLHKLFIVHLIRVSKFRGPTFTLPIHHNIQPWSRGELLRPRPEPAPVMVLRVLHPTIFLHPLRPQQRPHGPRPGESRPERCGGQKMLIPHMFRRPHCLKHARVFVLCRVRLVKQQHVRTNV